MSSPKGLPFAWQSGRKGTVAVQGGRGSTSRQVQWQQFGYLPHSLQSLETLVHLRQYCDDIHEHCLLCRDSTTQVLNVSEAQVAYWTRKFLVRKLGGLHQAGRDGSRSDIVKFFFVWRAIVLFQLPVSLSCAAPVEQAAADEPPVTGLLYQLLDDFLPNPIEERHNAVRHITGAMSVTNQTDPHELLASARNANIDIFCDKESQVSRTSDPHSLGRRLVYLLRCRPQLRLQDWDAFDTTKHADYGQYVNHVARRYCEVHHPWLFRLLFGFCRGADSDQETERHDLLAPLVKIEFDGHNWGPNVLQNIKSCLRNRKFFPPYASTRVHETVMLAVFGPGGSNLDDDVLQSRGLDFYLRQLFFVAYRDSEVAAKTPSLRQEHAAALKIAASVLHADQKESFLFTSRRAFEASWAFWRRDVEDLQSRVRHGTAKHLNTYLKMMLPSRNPAADGPCDLLHDLVFSTPNKTRNYYQRHWGQAVQRRRNCWARFLEHCRNQQYFPPVVPDYFCQKVLKARAGAGVVGDRYDRTGLLLEIQHDFKDSRHLLLRHMFAVADLDPKHSTSNLPSRATSGYSEYQIFLTRFLGDHIDALATGVKVEVASILLHWWHILRWRQEAYHFHGVGSRGQFEADRRAETELAHQTRILADMFAHSSHVDRGDEEAETRDLADKLSGLFKRFLSSHGKVAQDIRSHGRAWKRSLQLMQKHCADALQGVITARTLRAFKRLDGKSVLHWLSVPVVDHTSEHSVELFTGRLRLAVALYIRTLCRTIFRLAQQDHSSPSSLHAKRLQFFEDLRNGGARLHEELTCLLTCNGHWVGRTAESYAGVLNRLVRETRPGLQDGGLFGHCATLVSSNDLDFAGVMRSVIAMADMELLPMYTIGDLVKVLLSADRHFNKSGSNNKRNPQDSDSGNNWVESTGVAGVFKLFEILEWLEFTDPSMHAGEDTERVIVTPQGTGRRPQSDIDPSTLDLAKFSVSPASTLDEWAHAHPEKLQRASRLSIEEIGKCRQLLSQLLLDMAME